MAVAAAKDSLVCSHTQITGFVSKTLGISYKVLRAGLSALFDSKAFYQFSHDAVSLSYWFLFLFLKKTSTITLKSFLARNWGRKMNITMCRTFRCDYINNCTHPCTFSMLKASVKGAHWNKDASHPHSLCKSSRQAHNSSPSANILIIGKAQGHFLFSGPCPWFRLIYDGHFLTFRSKGQLPTKQTCRISEMGSNYFWVKGNQVANSKG